MDLISREEAINSVYDGTSYDILTEECKRHIEEVPSAFEGMTNVEVIKAVFPISEIHTIKDRKDGNVTEYVIGFDNDSGMVCSAKWADSPYKGVSE